MSAVERISVSPLTSCPLCGASEFKPLTTEQNEFDYAYRQYSYLNDDPIEIVQCCNCSFGFTASLPDASFFSDILYNPPDDHVAWEDASVPSGKESAYTEILQLLHDFGVRKSLVDLGACTGRFVLRAKEWFQNVVGIENDPRAVKQAKAKGLDVRQSTLLQGLRQLENKPEAITMIDVLEHVRDPLAHLEAVYAALPDGGLLYIKVPHLQGQLFKEKLVSLIRRKPTRMGINYVHINHFSERSLVLALEKCGFKLIYAGVAGTELAPWNSNWRCRITNVLKLLQFHTARLLRQLTPVNWGMNLEVLAVKRAESPRLIVRSLTDEN